MCAKAKKEKSRTANAAALNHPVAVAQIAKSYNTTGEVVLKLTSGLLEDFNPQEPVFIYFDELPVPFFIESFAFKGTSGALVKFEGINDLSHSEELIKKDIFIEAEKANTKKFQLEEENIGVLLTGFSLTDETGNPVGIITNYFEYPNNPCIEVTLHSGIHSLLSDENKETAGQIEKALIPFHEQLILSFSAAKREIQMDIPAGLLACSD